MPVSHFNECWYGIEFPVGNSISYQISLKIGFESSSVGIVNIPVMNLVGKIWNIDSSV
jgi:hypothetical protein